MLDGIEWLFPLEELSRIGVNWWEILVSVVTFLCGLFLMMYFVMFVLKLIGLPLHWTPIGNWFVLPSARYNFYHNFDKYPPIFSFLGKATANFFGLKKQDPIKRVSKATSQAVKKQGQGFISRNISQPIANAVQSVFPFVEGSKSASEGAGRIIQRGVQVVAAPTALWFGEAIIQHYDQQQRFTQGLVDGQTNTPPDDEGQIERFSTDGYFDGRWDDESPDEEDYEFR